MKAASTLDLVSCAVGAVLNAQGLLDDAELLAVTGRNARAYSVAALAVEEAGKSVSLGVLAVMPGSLRAQAPAGRMLEWHQLKLVGGMLITAVPPGTLTTMAAQLMAMAPSQVAEVVDNAQLLAQDMDRLKQRGLYADMDRGGRVRLPSEVTEADVGAQLDRARRAVSSASVLLGPGAAAFLAHPPAKVIDLCRAMVSAVAEAGYGRSPQAAADVWLDAVGKLRQQQTAGSRAKD